MTEFAAKEMAVCAFRKRIRSGRRPGNAPLPCLPRIRGGAGCRDDFRDGTRASVSQKASCSVRQRPSRPRAFGLQDQLFGGLEGVVGEGSGVGVQVYEHGGDYSLPDVAGAAGRLLACGVAIDLQPVPQLVLFQQMSKVQYGCLLRQRP